MAKLAALMIIQKKGTAGHYEGHKLFDDGSMEPVNRGDLNFAINWMFEKRYRAWGFWINDAPAIGIGVCTQDVIEAWAAGNQGEPLLTAPATLYTLNWWRKVRGNRFSDCRQGSAIVLGAIDEAGYVIMTTRTAIEIARLYRRWPGCHHDMAYVPEYIAESEHRERREREIRAGGRGAQAWAATTA